MEQLVAGDQVGEGKLLLANFYSNETLNNTSIRSHIS